MDREGLLNELGHYKRFSLQQYETIRLLKVEIMKIKKIANLKSDKEPTYTSKPVDPDAPVPDVKKLKDENKWLK